MKKIVIGIVIAVAIILVVRFVPLVGTKYQHTETYYEDEPYQVTETYHETVSLAYEVVESHLNTGSYLARHRIVIGGIVFQDEIVEVFYPIARVTIQNEDSVSGTFVVQLTFYAMDRSSAAQLCHPDFDFTDYLAPEDQEAYLDALDWDKLDLECFVFFADRYDGERQLALEPGEIGTAEYGVEDIDMSKHEWKWEYTITEPTKEAERERTVTKYRQVERERTETHYKRVPLFEYVVSRF